MIRCSVRLFAFVLAFLSVAVPSASAAADWPQFLGPTRDGHSPSTILDVVPKEGWPLRWKAAVGEGFSGPVVVSNCVYLFHRSEGQEVLSADHVTDGGLPS